VLTNAWGADVPALERAQNVGVLFYPQSSSSNALASFRTGVSRPSVNQA
jgi:hypothetical protein